VDKQQAAVYPSLVALSQSSVLIKPGKTASDDPAFVHELEDVQITAFGHWYGHIRI